MRTFAHHLHVSLIARIRRRGYSARIHLSAQRSGHRLGRSVSGDRCRAVTATTAVSGAVSAKRTGNAPMDRLVGYDPAGAAINRLGNVTVTSTRIKDA